jgi:hypothetical protein
MARRLVVKKITAGHLVHGKFVPNRKQNAKLPKLGSGKRFEACVKAVSARGGAYDPQAVCAGAGMRKYGKRKMAKLARAGKKRAAKRRSR